MSKKNKDMKEVVQMAEVEPKAESKVVPVKRALSVWRKKNPSRAMFLEDAEAVELFVKRSIPSLEATQEEFDAVFSKY